MPSHFFRTVKSGTVKHCLSFQVVLTTLAALGAADPLLLGGHLGLRAYGGPAFGYKTVTPLANPHVQAVVSHGAPGVVGLRTALPYAAHAAPYAAHAAPVAVAARPVAKVAAAVAPAIPAAPVAKTVAAAVPAVAAPVAGAVATQYHAQDEAGNWQYGYANPNSAKQERGNKYSGVVKGSYSYVDPYGLNQKVDYVADALGFRASGTNFPATAATLGLNRYRRSLAAVAPAAYAGILPAAAVAPAAYAATPLVAYPNGAVVPADEPAVAAAKAQHFAAKGLPVAPVGYAAAAAPVVAAPVAPVAYAAGPAAAVVASEPAAREAILTRVKLNPGHAVAYRVD